MTPAKYNGVKSPLQERLEKKGLGIMVGKTVIVGVGYADDTANLEESETTMRRVLGEFAKESADLGNRYKPENQTIITFGTSKKTRKNWKMGDIVVEEKEQATFLGRLIERKIEGTARQIRACTKKAKRQMGSLYWTGCFLDNRRLDMLTILYKSRIESVLIAGATLTQMDKTKYKMITAVQADIARRWAGVSRYVPNTLLLAELGWCNTAWEIKLAKMRLWERMKMPGAGRYGLHLATERTAQTEEGETRGLTPEIRNIYKELGKRREWKKQGKWTTRRGRIPSKDG